MSAFINSLSPEQVLVFKKAKRAVALSAKKARNTEKKFQEAQKEVTPRALSQLLSPKTLLAGMGLGTLFGAILFVLLPQAVSSSDRPVIAASFGIFIGTVYAAVTCLGERENAQKGADNAERLASQCRTNLNRDMAAYRTIIKFVNAGKTRAPQA